MKLIFFGEDSFSAIVLQSMIEANFEVACVICPQYNNFIYKRLEIIAQKFGVPFLRCNDLTAEIFLDKLKSFVPDLFVVAHFQRLLNKELMALPKIGGINLHPSLLPKYRGMSPQHWPIINGDEYTGVTVHFIDEGIDTGDIIEQEKIEIDKEMYVSDLQIKMIPLYKRIVVNALKKIYSGKLIPIVQRHIETEYYGRLKKKDCIIDLTKTKIQVYNLIRAVSKPYSGARYEDIIIWRSAFADDLLEKQLMDKYTWPGVYLNLESVNFARLNDGILIINDYEQNKLS